jgi:tripartite-type tricarboxylate transporter receptor subunit TctC
MRQLYRSAVIAIVLGFMAPAVAQDYPTRPVRIIDPFSPGGGSDLLARVVAQKLTERIGKQFIVENRPGGGGHIGLETLSKSAPDGYTLGVGGVPHAIGMTLYKKLNYDMAKDLTPISEIATFASVISVHPSLPVKNLKELIALAKARPGQLNFGANPGSPNHLSMELINEMAKVKMVHIGYKGAAPAVTDAVAGQIQIVSAGLPSVMQYLKSGRLRPIAVTTLKRSPLLPDVPTVDESGLKGYEVSSWYALFGPVGLPPAIVTKLNTEIAAALKAPEVVQRLNAVGAEPAPGSPEDLARLVRDEIKKWGAVVKASGATAG